MNVNYQGTVPKQGTEGSAAYDVYVKNVEIIDKGRFNHVKIVFDVRMQFDKDYVALLLPRSSIKDTGLVMCNSVGVCDSDYTGEYMMFLYDFLKLYDNVDDLPFKVGQRAGQVMFVKREQVTFTGIDFNSLTHERGGFGSTGK